MADREAPRDVVLAMYEAINARDFDAGFALLTPDFEWNEPSQAFYTGAAKGFDEIRDRLETLLEVFEDYSVEPEAFHEQGDRVAVEVRQRARGGASGVELEIRLGHLWTIRGGQIARLDVLASADDAVRALKDP